MPALEYVGQTMDGREVTIGPEDTEFVDGKPAAIVAIVDIAAEDGCAGVEAERDRWLADVERSDRRRPGVGVRPSRRERAGVHRLRMTTSQSPA